MQIAPKAGSAWDQSSLRDERGLDHAKLLWVSSRSRDVHAKLDLTYQLNPDAPLVILACNISNTLLYYT
jgi:hypothetical protein